MTPEQAYADFRREMIARRQQMGLSQRELAAEIGCSQSHLSEIETGSRNNPTLGLLQRWVAAVDGTLIFYVLDIAYANPASIQS